MGYTIKGKQDILQVQYTCVHVMVPLPPSDCPLFSPLPPTTWNFPPPTGYHRLRWTDIQLRLAVFGVPKPAQIYSVLLDLVIRQERMQSTR